MKNGKICDDSGYIYGEDHEMDDKTYSLSDAFEENTRDKIYICFSETTNGEKYLVEGNKLFYFS